jgi:phthalate 4,5-dioxygenase oxygenase subunit
MAMWESMGPIADRSEDHLGSSDLAVLQFRRQMVAAVKAFQKGEPALGTVEPRPRHAELASFEGMLRKGADWRSLTRRGVVEPAE